MTPISPTGVATTGLRPGNNAKGERYSNCTQKPSGVRKLIIVCKLEIYSSCSNRSKLHGDVRWMSLCIMCRRGSTRMRKYWVVVESTDVTVELSFSLTF